jgi:hypothetical protein
MLRTPPLLWRRNAQIGAAGLRAAHNSSADFEDLRSQSNDDSWHSLAGAAGEATRPGVGRAVGA